MRRGFPFLAAVPVLLAYALAWAADPVAVMTEIRARHGEVRVKFVGEAEWRLPEPLLALRPGDQVRASGDGQAVLVFVGARCAQVVSRANSPFVIQNPTGASGSEALTTMLANIAQFLLGQRREPTYQPLVVRGALAPPPVILSPRKTRLLPGPVAFEWHGPDRLRYDIRVFGPEGLLWSQTEVPVKPLPYPESAPALLPGVWYAWELEPRGYPAQRAEFELLTPSEAARVRASLDLLRPGALAGYPRNTIVLMRAGFLLQEGLLDGAQRELLAAIASDPEESTLHELLGRVYERLGLRDLAAGEFAAARP